MYYCTLTYYRAHSMELVGARVYVLDAEKKCLVGKVGIVTATSKNCLYLAVDSPRSPLMRPDTTSSMVDGSKETKEKQPIDITVTSNTTKAAQGALRVVREGAVLGLLLPSKASSFRSSKTAGVLFTETTITVEAPTLHENGGCAGAEAGIEQSQYQWDQREKADPTVSMCVLYGKHFLPHCTYS